MQTSRSLVTTDELAVRTRRLRLCEVFDCTTYLEPLPAGSDAPYAAVPGRHTFEAGHIPGADFLDLQGEFSDASTKLRFMMPKIAQLEEALGRHGIGADLKVVLYSIGSNMWATRFWWMLRSLGLAAAVLDGGFDKWQAEGRPVERGPARGYPKATFKAAASSRDFFVDKSVVLAAINDQNTVVVNALGPQFHRGQEPGRYGRPGRIPGSVNVPAATLFDADSKTFVPLADARAKFEQQGISKDKRIIRYCGGGISATIDLFQLAQLGYENLTLYDASMGEWATDPALPIETG